MKISQLKLSSKPKAELLKLLGDEGNNSRKMSYIATINPEQFIQANHDQSFQVALDAADITIIDGWGVKVASALLQPRVRSWLRIPGRELTQDFVAAAQQRQLTTLIVGGRDYQGRIDQVAQYQVRAATNQKQKQPGVYWTPGFKNVLNQTQAEQKSLTKVIEVLKPELVLVAFGAPHQEKWIHKNKNLLEKNGVRVAMVVGGSFDVLLGLKPKPPAWVSFLGLEFLFRLLHEPWRWRRQLRLVEFVWLVGLELFRIR